MRIATWMMGGASVGALGALAVGATMLFGACSSSTPPPPPPPASGGACATTPGNFPPPNCDDTNESCTPPMPACPTTPCNGSSACLAMADNSGKTTYDLRIRKLNVVAPPALDKQFIQAGVIDKGINLNNLCGEQGDGTFSWLIQFDPTAKTLTTGGAAPTMDPFGTGYCFVKETVNGLSIQPATVSMTQAADGSWQTAQAIPKLYVPIFVPNPPSPPQLIVLPITAANVKGVTISKDGNCIGSYNPNGVNAPMNGTCTDQDPSSCQRWHTAGSLGGYITLNEADEVEVPQLGKTLCVLLTGGTSVDANGHCTKDASGNVMAQGDYCSKTNMAGGCADSYWLAATFAASAAKINDGSADPNCNGSMVVGGVDAGADAAGGGDSGGPDAGADAAGGGDAGASDAAAD